ncbi:prostaglandin G/H synthase 2-like isoform X2 [Scylla paramamosain]
MREHNCVCDELLKTHPNLGMTTASTRLSALLSSLSSLTSRNHTHALYPVLEEVNENGRQLRFQGLYTYRRRFSMQPFTSFLDLAGDPKLAADLEHFCRDIEAVEYYVSLVTARPSPSVTLPSTVSLGGPWSVKGLVAAHLQP